MTVSASRPALRALTCAAALALLAGCSGNVQENPPQPLTDFTPTAELNGQWSEGIGSLSRARYPITPAISGDTIYAASAAGHLKAINIDNGQVRWEKDLDAKVSSGLTFDSGRLYFGTRNGQVMAVDGDSGDVAWRTTVSSEVLAPPQLNSSLVVVQSVDGALTALDRFTGEQQWLYTSSQPALTLRGTGTPRTIEPVTFAGFANGRLGVFDNRNGQQLWDMRVAVPKGRTAVEQLVDLDGQPVLTQQGQLFVTSYNGRVMALNARNGETLWSRDESSYLTPVQVGDHLFTVNAKSEILALDANTGRVIWKQDALSGRNLTAPVFINGELALGDYQGYIHLLDAETGEIAGRSHPGGDGISVQPLASGNHLYVFTNDGELIAYDLKQLAAQND
ncbi:outer membrane protein assembly factor BamB [Kushneria phosphatilytica]|uniref:Outer membrane protein assembly factor BamB n=1 Tax=Kushneria phosphatilytica TaxID=657387 RepID=A0A1S1NS71_9GAMM|nr:outer membrane protein assembly factor BamB [Kushneria phosphatilytica]OHV07779.1 outer membrane protein assembly factor BamB [Kushneria phosphatilytica]QEL10284.1 outer membrane protein assembly factor BamB [Kushneria phosphatilytica]